MTYNPQKTQEKQIRRAQAATQDFIDGVQATTKNPMERAIAKREKMKIAWLQAIDSGKWAENLGAVTVGEWKEITSKKGGARYAEGVGAAANKILQFHQQFSQFLASHMQKINSLPDTTAAERLNKMMENAKGIATFRFTRRR